MLPVKQLVSQNPNTSCSWQEPLIFVPRRNEAKEGMQLLVEEIWRSPPGMYKTLLIMG